jgi:hypothetical protein
MILERIWSCISDADGVEELRAAVVKENWLGVDENDGADADGANDDELEEEDEEADAKCDALERAEGRVVDPEERVGNEGKGVDRRGVANAALVP